MTRRKNEDEVGIFPEEASAVMSVGDPFAGADRRRRIDFE